MTTATPLTTTTATSPLTSPNLKGAATRLSEQIDKMDSLIEHLQDIETQIKEMLKLPSDKADQKKAKESLEKTLKDAKTIRENLKKRKSEEKIFEKTALELSKIGLAALTFDEFYAIDHSIQTKDPLNPFVIDQKEYAREKKLYESALVDAITQYPDSENLLDNQLEVFLSNKNVGYIDSAKKSKAKEEIKGVLQSLERLKVSPQDSPVVHNEDDKTVVIRTQDRIYLKKNDISEECRQVISALHQKDCIPFDRSSFEKDRRAFYDAINNAVNKKIPGETNRIGLIQAINKALADIGSAFRFYVPDIWPGPEVGTPIKQALAYLEKDENRLQSESASAAQMIDAQKIDSYVVGATKANGAPNQFNASVMQSFVESLPQGSALAIMLKQATLSLVGSSSDLPMMTGNNVVIPTQQVSSLNVNISENSTVKFDYKSSKIILDLNAGATLDLDKLHAYASLVKVQGYVIKVTPDFIAAMTARTKNVEINGKGYSPLTAWYLCLRAEGVKVRGFDEGRYFPDGVPQDAVEFIKKQPLASPEEMMADFKSEAAAATATTAGGSPQTSPLRSLLLHHIVNRIYELRHQRVDPDHEAARWQLLDIYKHELNLLDSNSTRLPEDLTMEKTAGSEGGISQFLKGFDSNLYLRLPIELRSVANAIITAGTQPVYPLSPPSDVAPEKVLLYYQAFYWLKSQIRALNTKLLSHGMSERNTPQCQAEQFLLDIYSTNLKEYNYDTIDPFASLEAYKNNVISAISNHQINSSNPLLRSINIVDISAAPDPSASTSAPVSVTPKKSFWKKVKAAWASFDRILKSGFGKKPETAPAAAPTSTSSASSSTSVTPAGSTSGFQKEYEDIRNRYRKRMTRLFRVHEFIPRPEDKKKHNEVISRVMQEYNAAIEDLKERYNLKAPGSISHSGPDLPKDIHDAITNPMCHRMVPVEPAKPLGQELSDMSHGASRSPTPAPSPASAIADTAGATTTTTAAVASANAEDKLMSRFRKLQVPPAGAPIVPASPLSLVATASSSSQPITLPSGTSGSEISLSTLSKDGSGKSSQELSQGIKTSSHNPTSLLVGKPKEKVVQMQNWPGTSPEKIEPKPSLSSGPSGKSG